MFNLIRIAAPLIAVALVAWFVYEVFVTGEAAGALTTGLPPLAGLPRSA